MRNWFAWFRIWGSQAQTNRHLAVLAEKLERLQNERLEWDLQLTVRQKAIDKAEEAYHRELQQGQRDLANSKLFSKKLEEALEATRDKLLTAEQITIPGLVAAHDVLLKRWRAESEILTLRSLASRAKDVGE